MLPDPSVRAATPLRGMTVVGANGTLMMVTRVAIVLRVRATLGQDAVPGDHDAIERELSIDVPAQRVRVISRRLCC